MTDPAPLNLLDALTEHQGYETTVYCTYGVDLAFFEEGILRPLRNNRCRRHIIFVDGRRYADTIEQWRDCAQFVGHHYLLVPIYLPPFQAFHPKLTLLVGPQRGRLLVGSGNLTFTGFGHNHELYTCLDWTPDHPEALPVFQAAWQFIEAIQVRWGNNRLAQNTLRKTTYQAPWLQQTEDDSSEHLIFWHSLQTPLLDQLEKAVGEERVRRVTAVTPFLDPQALAVAELNRRFQPDEIRLVLQPEQAVGDVSALTELQTQGAPLALYRFGESSRYLHAKLLLLETDTAVYSLSGSANCTRPALLATPEAQGNVETALLRRAEPADYFDYLLPANLLPDHPVFPAEIALRLPSPMITAGDQETAIPPLHLLDLRLESELLHIRVRWNTALPATNSGLQLRLDAAPPVFLPLILADGQQETSVPMSAELVGLFEQPISGKLVTKEADGGVDMAVSNALWVTNETALKQASAASWYGSGAAADVLASMAAESEAEWRDLYAEIQRLVLLDVAQVSQRPVLTENSSHRANKSTLPGVEQETKITLASEESILGLVESEVMATAVSRESELQAFFDHIRQRLPGRLPSPTQVTSEVVSYPIEKPKWTPERHTKTRFINLVKKYVGSLQNPLYRQQTAVRDSLIHYVVFQRIIWLLHTHQGLDVAECLPYWRDMNAGFFGGELLESPVNSPLLRQHCRYAWREEWMETSVPLYALTTLWQTDLLMMQQPELIPADEWAAEKRRILAFLRVVVDWDNLRQNLESLIPLSEVGDLYGQPAEDLALALLPWLNTDLNEIMGIFQRWLAAVAFEPQAVAEPHQSKLLYQANIDYRRALFHLYQQTGDRTKQRQIANELIFWARRADHREESHIWREHLIALFRAEGDDRQMAIALYRQAQQHLRDREYDLAEQLVREALALVNQLDYEPMKQRCESLLSSIKFLVR